MRKLWPIFRPRFSLKLAFIALTLAAIAIYALVVRPTQLANRFVAAVEARDYDSIGALLPIETLWPFDRSTRRTAVVDLIHADVLPRDWSDVLAARRRIVFRVAYHDDTEGRYVAWTEDTEIVARPTGLHAADFSKRAALFPRTKIPGFHRAHQALLP
jgi:hypothetical protein